MGEAKSSFSSPWSPELAMSRVMLSCSGILLHVLGTDPTEHSQSPRPWPRGESLKHGPIIPPSILKTLGTDLEVHPQSPGD